MKIVFSVLLTLALTIDPGTIAKINTLKSEARVAFKAGDFKTAIAKYRYLIDSLGVNEEEVMMNLSNAYFRNKDTANAVPSYQSLTQSKDTKMKSLANMQLGVLKNRQGKTEEALNYFKQALKTAPDNEDARFNYEMVKNKLEKEKKDKKDKEDKQDKKDQNKDNKDQKDQKDKKDQDKKDQDKKDPKKDQQDKKDKEKKEQEEKDKKEQESKDQKDKDEKDKKEKSKEEKDKEAKEKKDQEQKDKDQQNKDKKDIPPSVSEKLKDMQMSEQKAKMILEAMKNQEIQYLQQNKRKATKPKESGKPDW